jgi:hypothetical protein
MADLMKTLPHWAAMRENVLVGEIQNIEFGIDRTYQDADDESADQVLVVKYDIVTSTVVELPMNQLAGFINDLMEVEKQRLERDSHGA